MQHFMTQILAKHFLSLTVLLPQQMLGRNGSYNAGCQARTDQHTMQVARPEWFKVQYRLQGQNGSVQFAWPELIKRQCRLPIYMYCTVLFVLHQYTSYKSVNNMLREITNIKADICIYILFFSLQQYIEYNIVLI